MKRILTVLMTAVMIFAFSACAVSNNNTKVEAKCETKQMQNFIDILIDEGLISSVSATLDASYIGAKEGYRLLASDSNYGQVEVYYFTDTNGEYYKTALKSNEITLFDKTYKTAFSADNKIMVVYDSKITLPDFSSDTDKEVSSDSDTDNTIKDLFYELFAYKTN